MAKLKSVIEKFKEVQAACEAEKQKGTTVKSYNSDLMFKPKLIGKEKTTNFKIRFLPVEESPTGKPYIQINYHMFERDGDNKYIKVIDPRFFDPKAQNPIADLAKKLFDSDNAYDKKKASVLYRKPRYFTIVYVVEAPENQKEYEGKVLVWEAGVKVAQKLDFAREKLQSCFWDPYQGQAFLLSIKEAGTPPKVYPNYDDSSFMPKSEPISEDEKILEYIGEQLEKIKIKDLMVGADGIKSGVELLELLTGGTKEPAVEDTRPAKDLVNSKPISTKVESPDFGDMTETKKPEVVAQKAKPVEEKPKSVEKPAVKEAGSEIEDFDIDLKDVDFNL